MATFRIEKNKDYTVMSNYHLRDKNLSLKAKGLLSFMLSLPEEWDYSISGLVSCLKEKEKSVKSTLDELKENGYLVINKIRNEKGLFEYEYSIFEEPKKEEIFENEKENEENPGYQNGGVDTSHPDPHYPGVDEPGVDNGGQINTNIIIINNIYIDRWIDINNNLNIRARKNLEDKKYQNVLKEFKIFISDELRYLYSKEALNEAIIKQLVIKQLIDTHFDMTLINSFILDNSYQRMMTYEIKDNPVNFLATIIRNKIEKDTFKPTLELVI